MVILKKKDLEFMKRKNRTPQVVRVLGILPPSHDGFNKIEIS